MVICSLQGTNITAFVQSWSVMLRMVSHPSDMGTLVMKSTAIVAKGCVVMGVIGNRGGRFQWVTGLVA